jgi:hypothetical protein
MKHFHYTHCLVGVAIGVVLLLALGVSASTLGFLAVVLACPLMMFVMMRTMGDSHASAPRDESTDHTVGR